MNCDSDHRHHPRVTIDTSIYKCTRTPFRPGQNLEARQQDIKQKQGLITQSQEQVSKLEYTIRDQKMSNDRLQKDLEGVNLKVVTRTLCVV